MKNLKHLFLLFKLLLALHLLLAKREQKIDLSQNIAFMQITKFTTWDELKRITQSII